MSDNCGPDTVGTGRIMGTRRSPCPTRRGRRPTATGPTPACGWRPRSTRPPGTAAPTSSSSAWPGAACRWPPRWPASSTSPLDVFVVRKLGVPGHEELAFGALASGGLRVFNDDVVAALPAGGRGRGHRPGAGGAGPPGGVLPRRPPAARPPGPDGGAGRRRPGHRGQHAGGGGRGAQPGPGVDRGGGAGGGGGHVRAAAHRGRGRRRSCARPRPTRSWRWAPGTSTSPPPPTTRSAACWRSGDRSGSRAKAWPMHYRRLGASDLMVSEISLGSWLTYGAAVDNERGLACVRRAFEVGINFFDTANVYGGGGAETFLGEALSGVDRESYILGTKAFFPMPDGGQGLSAAQIRKQADASLKRLRTDYVDLYQCHRYDPNTPLEETMEALTELVQAGQGPLPGLQRVDGGADRGGPGHPRRGAVRVQPARVLDPLPQDRARDPRGVRAPRDQPDRVVAAGPGRAHRQVQAGRAAAGGVAGGQRLDGPVDGPLARRRGAGGGAAAAAHRRRPRPVDGPAGPGVGPAPAERGVGHHRRQPARADRRQRGRGRASPSTTATLAAIDEAVDGVVGP